MDAVALTESFAFISKSTISEDIPQQHLNQLLSFLKRVGISGHIPDECNTEDFYSDLLRGILKPPKVRRGHITCFVSVEPAVIDSFGGFHGGAIAAVAEAVTIATAKKVLSQDKDVFLGELSISYLSIAPKNAEVIVDASVVRSGRNLTVVATEFKLKKTEKLVYTARATLYHTPAAKL